MKKNFSDFTNEEQKDYLRKGSKTLIKNFLDNAFLEDETILNTQELVIVTMTLLSNLINTMFLFLEGEAGISREYLVDLIKKVMDRKYIKNQKE